MPSPFPGMNPYLERASVWTSFHLNFLGAAQFHLNSQLLPRYVAQSEARLYLHEPSAEERFRWVSDVGVTLAPSNTPGASTGTATVAPAYVTLADTVQTERVPYLTIRDRESRELVAVIELLSPTNKYAGPSRDQYLIKRLELLRSNTHLVEIDLLRGGPRMPPDELPTCDYCALVSRVEERPRAGVWPWRVRDALPVLPIPLRASDADARLDLKALIDQVYDGGGYHYLAYTGAPEPRLAPDDAAWAAQFVPAST